GAEPVREEVPHLQPEGADDRLGGTGLAGGVDVVAVEDDGAILGLLDGEVGALALVGGAAGLPLPGAGLPGIAAVALESSDEAVDGGLAHRRLPAGSGEFEAYGR